MLATKFSASGVMSSIGRTGFHYCRFMSIRNMWGRATSTASGGEPAIQPPVRRVASPPSWPRYQVRWVASPPSWPRPQGRGCPGYAADRLPSPRRGKSQQRPAHQRARPGLCFTTDLRWCTSARVLGIVMIPGKRWTLEYMEWLNVPQYHPIGRVEQSNWEENSHGGGPCPAKPALYVPGATSLPSCNSSTSTVTGLPGGTVGGSQVSQISSLHNGFFTVCSQDEPSQLLGRKLLGAVSSLWDHVRGRACRYAARSRGASCHSRSRHIGANYTADGSNLTRPASEQGTDPQGSMEQGSWWRGQPLRAVPKDVRPCAVSGGGWL